MMTDGSNTALEKAQDQSAGEDTRDNASGDFVTGLVTFIIFLFFMTAWMYFYSE